MEEDLYALLQNADPETLQLMLSALKSPEQIGIGSGLMQTPEAQGRNVGRTYVASSPLEHAGVLGQRLLGMHLVGQGQEGRGAGIQAYINALRAKPPQPVPPGVGMAYPMEDNTGP